MSGVNGSFTRVSVHVGGDSAVRCIASDGHAPLLEIGAGEAEVSFCLAGREIRASMVEFATELAREAARFAEQVQRLYAGQQGHHRESGRRRSGGLNPGTDEAGRLELVPPAAPVSPHVQQVSGEEPIVCVQAGKAR